MLQIAVCEDEPTSLCIMELMLREYAENHPENPFEFDSFGASSALMDSVRDGKRYDVYFLDIFMDQANGIQVAEFIRTLDRQAKIVFTTSSKEHALDAFRVNAMQYLLKPVEKSALYEILDALAEPAPKCPSIFINTLKGKLTLPYSKILYAEYYQHVITYVLTDGRSIPSRSLRVPFGEAVAPLLAGKTFVQSHKSFIVNLAHVASYLPNKFMLDSGDSVPISKSYRTGAKAAYIEYGSSAHED